VSCLIRVVTAAAAAAALAVPGAALAARPANYLERATIMDTFNVPGRSFASRCVRITVSTVDPRWAMLRAPARVPHTCINAGEVGDGFVLFLRAGPRALRWRDVFEGSDRPPCRVPRAVRRDLFGTAAC
jgi:hypothetical protein